MKDKAWYEDYIERTKKDYEEAKKQKEKAENYLEIVGKELDEEETDMFWDEPGDLNSAYEKVKNMSPQGLTEPQKKYLIALKDYLEKTFNVTELEREVYKAKYQEKNDKFFEDIKNPDVKVVYFTDGTVLQSFLYDEVLAVTGEGENIKVIGSVPYYDVYLKAEEGENQEEIRLDRLGRINGCCYKNPGNTPEELLKMNGIQDWTVETAILAGYEEKLEELKDWKGWDLKNSLFALDLDKIKSRLSDPELSDEEIIAAEDLINDGIEIQGIGFSYGDIEDDKYMQDISNIEAELTKRLRNAKERLREKHDVSEIQETISDRRPEDINKVKEEISEVMTEVTLDKDEQTIDEK